MDFRVFFPHDFLRPKKLIFVDEVQDFVNFLQSQPHKHKIVIGGNHDISMDTLYTKDMGDFWAKNISGEKMLEIKPKFLESMKV